MNWEETFFTFWRLTEEQLFDTSCKERQRLCQMKDGLLSYGDIFNKKEWFQ